MNVLQAIDKFCMARWATYVSAQKRRWRTSPAYAMATVETSRRVREQQAVVASGSSLTSKLAPWRSETAINNLFFFNK